MSELEEFKKVVSPIAYGLAYKSELGTTEYQQLYAEEDVIKYFNNKPQLTIPKSIADEFDQIYEDTEEYQTNVAQMFSSMQHYFVLESYPEILHWLEDDVKNTNVVLAYLAGKALGVDLVKVVEG
ncbi:hypothetical protein KGP38_10020 [Lactococcus lactis]|uniref:hypothetical protein n=1 Tax=Lactococcus lactis TaxID=1358 RepID=UPI001C1F23F7|nr:hypothetical protein [Lactococcus lactis]MBU7542927.1 hypothetical protein [Lactococcus lactis]MDT3324780.1 hypothetical protein [Bacillota bacterium]